MCRPPKLSIWSCDVTTFSVSGRAHDLPIGRMTQSLLENIPRLNRFVFPARIQTATHFNGWGQAKAKLDAELDGVAPFTLHDLRRTFASNMARLGVPIIVTEKLLNHVSGTVSGIVAVYNRHSYQDEMREALAIYEDHLQKIPSPT